MQLRPFEKSEHPESLAEFSEQLGCLVGGLTRWQKARVTAATMTIDASQHRNRRD